MLLDYPANVQGQGSVPACTFMTCGPVLSRAPTHELNWSAALFRGGGAIRKSRPKFIGGIAKSVTRPRKRESDVNYVIDLIDAWLSLPAVALFAVLIAAFALSGILWSCLSFWSPLSPRVRTLTGVVAPYFGSIGILFSLLAAFLANEIADQQRQAWRAVHNEASAIITAYTLSLAAPSGLEEIRAALRAYARSVLVDEWPKMAKDQRSALVDKTMHELLRRISDRAISREAGPALQNNLLRTVLQIREARSDRLALSFTEPKRLNWAIVLVLGIFTQLAIALVHLERPRAQAAALFVFSVAVVIALGLIALQEHPFRSTLQVSAAPIRRAMSLIVPP